MNKTVLFLVALFAAFAITATLAEPSSHHRRHYGRPNDAETKPIRLKGDQCNQLLKSLLKNYKPADAQKEGHYTPYNTIMSYPIDDLELLSFTNTRITALNTDDCIIQWNKQHEMWTLVAGQIKTTIENDFSYKWDENLPFLDDKGSLTTQITDLSMIIYLKRFTIDDYYKKNLNKIDTVAPLVPEKTKENGDKALWRTFITTYLQPDSIDMKTTETDYSDYYNTLFERNQEELTMMLSSITNTQLASWFNHYCVDNGVDNDEFDCQKSIDDVIQAVLNAPVEETTTPPATPIDDPVDVEEEVEELDETVEDNDEIEEELVDPTFPSATIIEDEEEHDE